VEELDNDKTHIKRDDIYPLEYCKEIN